MTPTTCRPLHADFAKKKTKAVNGLTTMTGQKCVDTGVAFEIKLGCKTQMESSHFPFLPVPTSWRELAVSPHVRQFVRRAPSTTFDDDFEGPRSGFDFASMGWVRVVGLDRAYKLQGNREF